MTIPARNPSGRIASSTACSSSARLSARSRTCRPCAPTTLRTIERIVGVMMLSSISFNPPTEATTMGALSGVTWADPQFERHEPALDERGDRGVGRAVRHRDILGALRLREVAGLVEAEVDVSLFVPAFEFPGLHAGAHHRDLVGCLVDVIAPGLQRLLPDADAADRHEDRGEFAFVGFTVLVGNGFTAGVGRHHLLLAGARLVCNEVAEMDGIDDVGFDDADSAFCNVDGVLDRQIP